MAVRVTELLRSDQTRFEPVGQQIRGMRNGAAIVDSHRAMVVWPPGAHVPRWAFPVGDVEIGELDADAVTRYDEAELAGFVSVSHSALERWLVDDEVVMGHPRDPFTRIDVYRTSRPVEVRIGGELVATSTRARALYETGLRVRYYLPASDIRTELFVPSDTRSVCPYKGEAIYRSVRVGDTVHADVVWSYPFPLHDAEPVRDLWCFYDEKVDLTVG